MSQTPNTTLSHTTFDQAIDSMRALDLKNLNNETLVAIQRLATSGSYKLVGEYVVEAARKELNNRTV